MSRRPPGRSVGWPVAAFLALPLVVAGCELTTVDVAVPDDVVVAEAYLRTDVAVQELFLHRTLPGSADALRVDGATARVIDAAGNALPFGPSDDPEACARYSVFESGEGGSCYTTPADQAFVQPGATYRLEVELPSGGLLLGETTVPGDFRVLQPAVRACRLEGPSFSMIWSRSDGAWSYQTVAQFQDLAVGLRELGVEDPPDELTLTGLAIGGADTVISFPNEFGVFDRFSLERDLLVALQQGMPPGSTADVVVAAADRNFVNWVRGGNFNPSGQVRIPSLSGPGTGVFASLVIERRTVVSESAGGSLASCD